jgi:hypothetical protein
LASLSLGTFYSSTVGQFLPKGVRFPVVNEILLLTIQTDNPAHPKSITPNEKRALHNLLNRISHITTLSFFPAGLSSKTILNLDLLCSKGLKTVILNGA